MANGIDWFRWHHGSVSDQKFGLVARKAGATVADVIAVWACLLEAASASADRGNPGTPDFESLDCALGLSDGKASGIYERMRERGLIDQAGRIEAWDRRQPKRERQDDTATERKRLQRERDCASAEGEVTPPIACVTPRHATSRQNTPREEKSREEEIQEPPSEVVGKPAASRPAACPTQALVDLYHTHLPMLPRVEVMNESRRRSLSARWREVITDPDIRRAEDPRTAALEWFAWFFAHCARSRFLTGKAKDWRADFDFLLTPTKFTKAVEGHYHKETAR